MDDKRITILTDGSYNRKDNTCGYGNIIIDKDNKRIIKIGGVVTDPDLIKMWNVGGELEGAMRAINYCLDNNYSALELIYDYSGVYNWVRPVKPWKITKDSNPAIKRYFNKVQDAIDNGLIINFIKIKGHTDPLHNLADEYANKGRYASKDNPILEVDNI